MTYLDLIRDADRKIDNGDITLGEYEKMIEPLKLEIQPVRKKGKWIVSHVPGSMLWECNQCSFDCGAHSFNYCPKCGADMRGEKNETD